ncbi:glycosyltransferase family 25 protein [Aeromonas sp. MdU4]|uniref:glycosyltransferase family 25 protein n=1 Tax=Aeromonas sp. MdU4 TaxID=3342819 RepID=UPI0035B9D157
MKIYVINLERSIERKMRMSELLTTAGVEYEFFPAIDGRIATISGYDSSRRIKEKGHPLTLGEQACFLSHRALWLKCIELNVPIVVMEDDIDLTENFSDVLKHACIHLSSYKYIRLGRAPIKSTLILPKVVTLACLINNTKLVKYSRGPSGAYGYIIHPEAARKFVNSSSYFWMPVDDYMDCEYIHGVSNIGIEEPVIKYTDIQSEIGYSSRQQKGNRTLASRIRKEYFRYRLYILQFIFNIIFYLKRL